MSHMRFPKELISAEPIRHISNDAKILYAFLADRASLSRKNGEKWEMSKGEYFVICTQAETMRVLNCGHEKATAVMKELEEHMLIKRYPQGLGKPHKIVVNTTLVECKS